MDEDEAFRFLGDLAEDPKAHLAEARMAKKILIDKRVTMIAEAAFSNAECLKELNFEEDSQLETIGKDSFANTNIDTLTIPSSVKEIGEGAFQGNIDYDSDGGIEDEEEEMEKKHLKKLIFGPESQLERIGDRAFSSTKFSSVCIPRSLRKIGDSCFFESVFLEEVCFEKGSQLETIPEMCFLTTRIKSITIPSSVKEIGERAFGPWILELRFEEGSKLEKIGKKAFEESPINTIEIPSSVKEICEGAFLGSEFWRDVTVEKVRFKEGSKLEKIGKEAFKNLTNIKTIELPMYLKEIGEGAFCCTGLEELHFAEGSRLEWIRKEAFAETKIVSVKIPSFVREIGEGAFRGELTTDWSNPYVSRPQPLKSKLTNLTFRPDSQIQTIGDKAFYRSTLSKICIPRSEEGFKLKTIGKEAFAETELEAVTIPSSVEEIGEGAFRGELPECSDDGFFKYHVYDRKKAKSVKIDFEQRSKLRKIGKHAFFATTISTFSIPSSAAEINEGAFGATNLEKLTFEQGFQLAKIGEYTFYCTNLSTVLIPSSVKDIGKGAFYKSALQEIHFEEGCQLTKIGSYAFSNTNLSTVAIHSSVTEIGERAFFSCPLEELTFPQGVQLDIISKECFAETKIDAIAIPPCVKEIGEGAFRGEYVEWNLKSVDTPKADLKQVTFGRNSQLEKIGKEAFYKADISKICIPCKVIEIGESAFEVSALEKVEFEPDSALSTIGGMAFCYSKLTSISIPPSLQSFGRAFRGLILQKVEFPEGIEKICGGAFFGVTIDCTMCIPSSVTEIGAGAFAQATLQKLEFESGSQLSKIGDFAFDKAKLSSIYIPSSVTEIGYCAFHKSKLNEVTFGSDSQLETIGARAFLENPITTIFIPKSVKQIGEYTFYDSMLQKVVFQEGSQLEAIEVRLFEGTKLSSICIPSSVTEIKIFAFLNSKLNEMQFQQDSQLQAIGTCVFKGTSISFICLPSALEKINDDAFNGSCVSEVKFEKGSQLKKIDSFAFRGEKISALEIPSSVKEICEGALRREHLPHLKKVTFAPGSQLVTIGAYAFEGANLSTILIPKSVETIEKGAFFNSEIQNVQFETGFQPKNLGERIFSKSKISTTLIPSSWEKIASCLFDGSELKKVDFERDSHIQTIESNAFRDTKKLTTIVIPSSVEIIEAEAFASSGLEEVTFEPGSKVEKICQLAFENTKLSSIAIPSTVKEIGTGAFCRSTLKKVTFEPGSQLQKIHKNAFQDTNISTICLPSTVHEIGESAFKIPGLNKVQFESGSHLQKIGSKSFYSTDILTICLPSTVQEIGESVFENSALQKVEFQENSQLQKIGSKSFYSTNVSTICLPSTVQEIGESVFENSALQKVEFQENSQLQKIGSKSFYSTNILTICLPSTVQEIGESAFENSALQKVEFQENSQLNKIGPKVFQNCESLECVSFGRNSTCSLEIKEKAFGNCYRLAVVNLSHTVDRFDETAFQRCRWKPPYIVTNAMLHEHKKRNEFKEGKCEGLVPEFETRVLVNNVERIPKWAISGATRMKYLELPPGLKIIDDNAISGCDALEFVEIPYSTKSICDNAFQHNTDDIKIMMMVNDVYWAICKLSRVGHHGKWNFMDTYDVDTNVHAQIYFNRVGKLKFLFKYRNAYVVGKKYWGMSALHLYLRCGHSEFDIIELMAELDPESVKSCDSRGGRTALHFYLSRGHSDLRTIEWMIKKNPEAIVIRDNKGRYPIHCFCESPKTGHHLSSHSSIARLLAKGVSLMVPDGNGVLPFSYALENLSWSAVETLYSFEPVQPFGEFIDLISGLKKEYFKKILTMKEQPRSLDTMEQNGWVKFVSYHIYPGSPEAKDIIDLIETCNDTQTVKILAYARTLNNLSALETAIPEVRQALQKRLLFLKRYDINTSYVIHKSHTCIVLEARDANMDKYYDEIFDSRFGEDSVNEEKFRSFLTDYGIVGDQDENEAKKYFDKIDSDESGTINKLEFLSFCKEHLGDKVVLKLMKNADQFQNEIESRSKLKSDSKSNEIESRRELESNSKSVIGILRSHSPCKNAHYGTQEDKAIDTSKNHAGDINNENEALDENEATLESEEVAKKGDQGIQEGEVTDSSKTIDDFLNNCTQVYNSPDVSAKDLKEHVQDIFNRLNKKSETINQMNKKSETLEVESATSYKYIIVMVKGGKNLDSIFRSEQPGSNAIRGLAKEVGGAILSVHNCKIIHGDIKMLNVVRDENANRLKLIDLDASVQISEFITSKFSSGVLPPEAIRLLDNREAKDATLRRLLDEAEKKGSKKVALWDDLGKNAFIVKNVFEKDEICTILKEDRLKAETSLDVWAFGVLLYALCTGQSLFSVNRDDDIVSFEAMKELYNWDRYKKGKLHRVEDPYARRLLNKILERNPSSRPGMKTILKDDFFDPSKVVDMGVVTKQLDRMEEKIDAVAEQIKSINQNLAEANNMISELLSVTTPRLVFFDPTAPKKAENWLESIKENVKLHNKIKICFACPITYKIPTDDKGNKKGYVMKVPTEWVQVWGPRIVMTLKVSQFALSVGRMAGFPIPHFLDGIQEKFDSATEKFGMAGKILNDVMNEDLMKEFVGQNELFSTGMDLINHKTTIGDVVENKTEKVMNNIQEASAMEKPDKLQGLIKQSVEDIREIAKEHNDDEEFALTGLKRTVAKDKSVEFVHPDAVTFFKEHGKKIFEMSVQDMLSKFRKHKDAEKLAALEEKRKAEIKEREDEIIRVNKERDAEIERMNKEREAWKAERALYYKERDENENKASNECGCTMM